jgi:hypothetical protein
MLDKIQSWFTEAASLHGDDWTKIEHYVAQRLSGLSAAERCRMLEEFRVLVSPDGERPN